SKLQQDVRRFIYEREKVRAAAVDGGFSPLSAQDLQPYPGALLGYDLEEHAMESLLLHRPAIFDTTILDPEAFVRQSVEVARRGVEVFRRFARQWPEAMEMLGSDRALRHVAKSILP